MDKEDIALTFEMSLLGFFIFTYALLANTIKSNVAMVVVVIVYLIGTAVDILLRMKWRLEISL